MPPSSRSKRRRVCTSPASIPLPRPRTHAFTGCSTCRERHVKCDLATPSCKNCSRLKLTCEGYLRRYSWIPTKLGSRGESNLEPVDDIEHAQSSRRVLFSDEEREAMSIQMRNECCEHSPTLDLDKVLRELQERILELNGFSRIGPFGVLLMNKEASEPPMDTSLLDDHQTKNPNALEEPRLSTPELNYAVSQIDWHALEDPETWESIEVPNDLLANAEYSHPKDIFTAEDPASWDVSIGSSALDCVYLATGTADAVKIDEQDTPTDLTDEVNSLIPTATHMASTIQDHAINSNSRPPYIVTMSNNANLSKIPSEARHLLSYYSERIIDVMSMSTTNKPPWKTIHLPCAMGAFADLVVHGEGRSLARMSLFYALLSISSFHIGFASEDGNSRYWRDRGELHKKTSESYLTLALRNDMPKSARGKYKELLMSGLSMVTIGVFSGNMQNVHAHLGDSEALIRKEGLPKPVKSQKISKLHHIFSFLRIIHESTSLRGRQSVNDHDLNELQSLVTQDNAETSGSRLAWVDEDEPEDTEEDPLFVSIYQLPTTLLSLLSQTSSLCKQLHSPEASSPAFARRCQIIEDRIFKWTAPENLALPNYEVVEAPDLSTGPGREIAAHLVNATYHALIVHFQRQIRNTNPRVLQHYVTTAADHLLIHEQLKQSHQISTAPFPWPGFIVGCEAYDITSRQKIDIYLKMVRCYNVGSLIKAEKVVYEVWRRQDSARKDSQWEDVLRDWDMQVVLT